jgi:hypothetical protein
VTEEPVADVQEIWAACVEFGDVVFDVHDRVPWQRSRRLERYAVWRMTAPAADRLSRTLLALRLHALSHDAAVTTGRPLTREDLAGLPLRDVASRVRPHYELFAGLAALPADADRSHAVTVLRFLSYEQPGGALALARLDTVIGTAADRLLERYRDPGLTFRDLAAGRPPR